MEYSLNENKLNLVIYDGGLNTIYNNYKKKFTLYQNLLLSIIDFNYFSLDDFSSKEKIILEKFDIYQIINEFLDKNNHITFFIKNSKHLDELYINFLSFLNKKFINYKTINDIQINFNHFEAIDEQVLLNEEGKNLILMHENLVFLLTDYIVLKNFKFEKKFIYVLENENSDKNTKFKQILSKSPKNFIFYTHKLEKLFIYKNIGTWSVYLTNYVSTTENKIKNEKIAKVVTKNLDISLFTNQFNDFNYIKDLNEINKQFIKKYGRFFNFAHISFNCSSNYVSLINNLNAEDLDDNKANARRLNEIINKTNPLKILVLIRSLFKYREFSRAAVYYVNDDKFNFNFFCGFEDLDDFHLNGEFDVIFYKLTRGPEIDFYSKLIENTKIIAKEKRIYIANDFDNLECFNDRAEMVKMLNHIVDKSEDLTSEFKIKLSVPDSKLQKFSSINNKEKFRNFLTENNFRLPLILKLDGPTEKFDHFMCSIVSDKGIDNFVDYLLNYSEGVEEKVNILIQTFFNHGGKVIKSYYINRTAYTYIRPSLPDMLEEYCNTIDEFKDGYFCFYTSDLISKKFQDLWKKFQIDNEINNKINFDFLEKVCRIFENESQKTLFGLDFLYNEKNNEYSLVDCNFFPGYKELKAEFGSILKDHILYYYNKFKQI